MQWPTWTQKWSSFSKVYLDMTTSSRFNSNCKIAGKLNKSWHLINMNMSSLINYIFLFILSILLTHKKSDFSWGFKKKLGHTDLSAILNPTHSFLDLLSLQRHSCPQSQERSFGLWTTMTTALPSTDEPQFTWLQRWLPLRLSKHQSMSTATVLFWTTLYSTQTITLNRLPVGLF